MWYVFYFFFNVSEQISLKEVMFDQTSRDKMVSALAYYPKFLCPNPDHLQTQLQNDSRLTFS